MRSIPFNSVSNKPRAPQSPRRKQREFMQLDLHQIVASA